MLSPSNRLTTPVHFREVVRRGRRCGGPLMVVHLLTPSPEAGAPAAVEELRVGFVVSKAVGNAVTRNLVKRRLRHLVRERIDQRQDGGQDQSQVELPSRGMLVVRALPAAAGATYDDLAGELDRCLAKLSRPQRSAAITGVSR